ncbi:hypothetical protein BH11GEM2_BH11GEM2_36240 [soil metagenome]
MLGKQAALRRLVELNKRQPGIPVQDIPMPVYVALLHFEAPRLRWDEEDRYEFTRVVVGAMVGALTHPMLDGLMHPSIGPPAALVRTDPGLLVRTAPPSVSGSRT